HRGLGLSTRVDVAGRRVLARRHRAGGTRDALRTAGPRRAGRRGSRPAGSGPRATQRLEVTAARLLPRPGRTGEARGGGRRRPAARGGAGVGGGGRLAAGYPPRSALQLLLRAIDGAAVRVWNHGSACDGCGDGGGVPRAPVAAR